MIFKIRRYFNYFRMMKDTRKRRKKLIWFSILLVITSVVVYRWSYSNRSKNDWNPEKVPTLPKIKTSRASTMTTTSTTSAISTTTTTSRMPMQTPVRQYPFGRPFECYKNSNKTPTLPLIETRNVTPGKNIAFLETMCTSSSKGKIYLSPRHACAVESAALRNPNLQVHVMFLAPVALKFSKNSKALEDKIMQAVLSYKNVYMSRIDLDTYFAGTPVEDLYKSGLMETSNYPGNHMADILRYLTLWKYGSIYLDLDVISFRTFEDMGPNFSGFEDLNAVAVGVMSFAATGSGHNWIRMILDNINKHYNPAGWGSNANEQLSRLLTIICNGTQHFDDCQGFRVYEPEVFYPWRLGVGYYYLYDTNIAQPLSRLKNSRAVHWWNNRYKMNLMNKGNRTALEIVFMINCPKVYAQIPDGSLF